MTRTQPKPLNQTNKPENRIGGYQQRVREQINAALSLETEAFPRLFEAMTYSLNAGGKRIRPLLAYASAEALEIPAVHVDAFACALELIHTYSLIHDDLPAMDDDDLRRGRQSCHVAFDEATAILAGDALLTLSFRVLAEAEALADNPAAKVELISRVATACGALGMAGGQSMDLQLAGTIENVQQLEQVHRLKTGALLQCAITAPMCLAGAGQQQYNEPLGRFAESLGVAFQVYDDYLDVTASTETMGKPAGSDIEQNKVTYPSLVGAERSLEIATELVEEALQHLELIEGDTSLLAWAARMIIRRDY
jgi:farnesyl diphosphate synthase